VVPAYEASYVPTALGLVKAGLGIAVIALSAAGEAAEHVGLRARPIDHPMLVRHISLIESARRYGDVVGWVRGGRGRTLRL